MRRTLRAFAAAFSDAPELTSANLCFEAIRCVEDARATNPEWTHLIVGVPELGVDLDTLDAAISDRVGFPVSCRVHAIAGVGSIQVVRGFLPSRILEAIDGKGAVVPDVPLHFHAATGTWRTSCPQWVDRTWSVSSRPVTPGTNLRHHGRTVLIRER